MSAVCPRCGRGSFEYSRGRNESWCRYVVDCGYASRQDERTETRRSSQEDRDESFLLARPTPEIGMRYRLD